MTRKKKRRRRSILPEPVEIAEIAEIRTRKKKTLDLRGVASLTERTRRVSHRTM
jgi:hypothetical protein